VTVQTATIEDYSAVIDDAMSKQLGKPVVVRYPDERWGEVEGTLKWDPESESYFVRVTMDLEIPLPEVDYVWEDSIVMTGATGTTEAPILQ
jgi:hypothetical protein